MHIQVRLPRLHKGSDILAAFERAARKRDGKWEVSRTRGDSEYMFFPFLNHREALGFTVNAKSFAFTLEPVFSTRNYDAVGINVECTYIPRTGYYEKLPMVKSPGEPGFFPAKPAFEFFLLDFKDALPQ